MGETKRRDSSSAPSSGAAAFIRRRLSISGCANDASENSGAQASGGAHGGRRSSLCQQICRTVERSQRRLSLDGASPPAAALGGGAMRRSTVYNNIVRRAGQPEAPAMSMEEQLAARAAANRGKRRSGHPSPNMGRRMSAASQQDGKWLESMTDGFQQLESEKRFKEDSFLTEMFSTTQLRRILLPYGRFRRWWDALTLILVMYTAISLPLVICFANPLEAATSPSQTFFQVVDVFTDVIFMIDLSVNFHTAFVTKDAVLEINKSVIAKHYLTTWFPVDAAGSIPWELITIIGEAAGFKASDAQAVQIIKILKTPKLLRLGRLFKFLARFEGAANIGRIVMLMLLFMLLLHWLACLFFIISDVVYQDPVMTSWLESNAFEELPNQSQYVRAYYAVVLMIMGDNINLQSDAETIFAIIAGLVGSCVNAIIFANVANLTAQLNSNSALHQRRMDGVAQAMRTLNVEPSTARRIRDYYEYVWIRHRDHEGDHFIRSLPSQLRSRTSCMIHEHRMRLCPLFNKCDRKFIAALSTTLLPEVYLPAEFIVVSGFVSRAMFFIARGRVQLIRRGAEGKMQIDEASSYFDEAGLFTERQHALYARSITHTDLYKLERAEFERVVKDFPASGWLIASAASRHLPPEDARMVNKVVMGLVGAPEGRKAARGTAARGTDADEIGSFRSEASSCRGQDGSLSNGESFNGSVLRDESAAPNRDGPSESQSSTQQQAPQATGAGPG
jgi:CRP-like cAMP-binding protein